MTPRIKINECPTCGSRKIKRLEGQYIFTSRGVRVVVPDLQRHECPVCGEILLDYDAMKQIEALRPQRKSGGRTAIGASPRALKRGA